MVEMYRLPEVPLESVSLEEVELVIAALHDPKADFRTISGIEADTGIAPAHIAAVLVHSGLARKAIGTHEGESLFTAAERPKKRREIISEIVAMLSRTAR